MWARARATLQSLSFAYLAFLASLPLHLSCISAVKAEFSTALFSASSGAGVTDALLTCAGPWSTQSLSLSLSLHCSFARSLVHLIGRLLASHRVVTRPLFIGGCDNQSAHRCWRQFMSLFGTCRNEITSKRNENKVQLKKNLLDPGKTHYRLSWLGTFKWIIVKLG